MDWAHRWFRCRNCDSYIPTPKAFLDHKKNCKGLHSVTDSRVGPNRKKNEKILEGINTPEDAKPKEFQRQICLNSTPHKPCTPLLGGSHTSEKPFVCKLCDYASSVHGSLIRHMKHHTGKTPFKCSDCPASFNSRQTLGHHVARQHPIEEYQPQRSKVELNNSASTDAMSKKFKCEFCEYVSKSFRHLKHHIRTHTGVKPFVCKLCNYSCTQPSSLKTHNRVHAGETPFKCRDCPASFNSRKTLGYHVARQHQHPFEEYQPQKSKVELSSDISTDAKSKKFKCEFCEYVTKRFPDIKRHIRIHTGVKPFVCKLCNYAFTQPSSLTKHNRVHAGDTPFKCNECPASFNTRKALAVHNAKQHKKRGPNKHELYSKRSIGESKSCRFCSKMFRFVRDRKEHERIHTGERPFKCNKCGASFKKRSTLQAHMVTHGDVKKFKCGFCNYACHRKRNLPLHVRIHAGEKPYKCSKCDAAFRQSSNLNVHMGNHHSTEEFKCQSCKYVTKSKATLRAHSKRHTKNKHKCDLCAFASHYLRSLQNHYTTKHGVIKLSSSFANTL